MESDLKSTPLSRCLENKLMMFGFEAIDILAILLTLSTLNLLFGQLSRVFLVIAPSLTFALILRIGKRGKPEGYLLHWLKFQFRPGVYSAFEDSNSPKSWPRTDSKRVLASKPEKRSS
jgi:hypothetical protein